MPTTKHRINVIIPADIEQSLSALARRERVPEATKASELLRLAIELEEDRVWDNLARERDTKGAKFISHKKVWR